MRLKMSNRKRRAYTKKLKEKIGSVTMKELEEQGEIPRHFHLFSLGEMKEYNRKKNKRHRMAFKERLEKYDFIDEDEWW